jgi:type II secretory ATPase GspE/PulE/Tfp pilus assembly ATPase PilB-like protein
MTVQFDEEKQRDKIIVLRHKEEEALAETMASRYGVPYLDLNAHPINIDAIRIIKEADAHAAGIAAFNVTDKKIEVAVLSPASDKTTEAIEDLKRRGYVPEIFMVSHLSLEKVWDRYKDLSYSFETKSGALDISNDEILGMSNKIDSLEDVKKFVEEVLSMKRAYRISRILEIILASAIALKASDIHIEPEESGVRLRFRLDGVLIDVLHFDKETFELMTSRIKLISELKLNITEKAQDGRFSIKLSDLEIEIRTSLLPGPYGESVVLRVLDPRGLYVNLDKLGIHSRLLKVIDGEIKKPNGMILTTGPTGSGKTTTLYAFLKKVYTSEIKIITIENPIEYHIEGVVQTQVDPDKNYTFAEGLRSSLRQDPDVIMVGEIRDSETASVAINAALTGHLVLSTLHTNNAAGAFPRLLDLGVNSKVISSALNLSIAQRLVRKLCDKCKDEIKLEGETQKKVMEIVSKIDDKSYLEGIQTDKMWVSIGCEECHGIGFKGRIGIYEAILIDDKIEKAVIANPSERDIREAAKDQHLLTMVEDGILKVLSGMTSLEELDRVIDLSSN